MEINILDIGHGAKQLDLHKLWSRRIIEEFYLQVKKINILYIFDLKKGEKEVQYNIALSPLNDRSQFLAKVFKINILLI